MQDQIEGQQRRKKIIRFLYLLFFSIIIVFLIVFFRGPHISDILKKTILPEFEVALQQKVIAKKISINIFPLFIEAKDIKVFDKDGSRILFVKRVKGYIEPLGLLQKRIAISRLVIKGPDLSLDREHLVKVIENVKAYLKKESRFTFKVRINVVEVSEGSASLQDKDLETSFDIKGLRSEMILSKIMKLNISVKQLDIKKEGLPELTGDITTLLVLKQNEIEIRRLTIGSYGSKLKASGLYSNGRGTLKSKVSLIIDSIKRILHLKQKGEGKISAEGEIRFENLQRPDFSMNRWGDIFINLQLKGDFYIQTLMEILKVTEKIEGFVDFQGEIKGKLSDISGRAKARLRKGNLFGVDIDTLRCEVTYDAGLMRFMNGDAELYSGHAKAEVSINIPHVEPFTLNIKFASIDSGAAFKLIGWDPEIRTGKVEGELMSSGNKFNPDGWFIYEAQSRKYQPPRENALDRIKNIKGTYSLRGDNLSLSDLQVRTSLSDIQAEGTINLTKKTLDFKSQLTTREVSDLILPYYAGLKGQGNFSGRIKGTFDNPEISGKADISSALVEGYKANHITSQFSYNKNLLNVQELLLMPSGEEHRVKGRILFPEAEKLFDFSKPVFEMNATVKNADLGGATQVFSKDIPAQGRINADLKIGGKGKNIVVTGDAHIKKATVYNIPIDSASIVFAYLNNEFTLKKSVIKKGTSMLTAEGKISNDKNFSFRASSDKILMDDFGFQHLPVGTFLILQSEGHGTLKNPTVQFNVKVVGGAFEGQSIGNGIITCKIKDKQISVQASLFDEKIELRGTGHLDAEVPWNAKIALKPGRYDFVLGSILKDIPEDLLLNLRGHVEMSGNRRNIRALAVLNQLTLELLGYSFSNDSDIKIQINNRRLSFPALAIRSGGTSLVKLQGSAEIGKEYDLHLKGKSSLSPLKALSKKVEHLTGDADLNLSLVGKWENPDMRGELTISDASIGLKGTYSRIVSINGSATIDEDKVVVERLSGKMGGGTVDVSGLVHLKAFHIKRFSFESRFNSITTYLLRDFSINFNGNLIYEGTLKEQSINGNIKINSAKYREKVDWKSLILRAKTAEKPKADLSEFERAELNISISGDENIHIDNNVVRAPVRVDMIARGTISQPILFGRLETKEGVFYFRNNEFKIIHASADFIDPNRLNPFLELMAETSIKGYTVKLNLEGQIEHFDLNLSSKPPLEDTDILSLLALGYVGKESKGLKGGIGAGAAASFLAGTLQEVFDERLKTVTGLDRIQIGSHVSKTTGSVEPQVTVSKRLLGDKVFVTYSNVFGATTTGEQILKIEYFLDRKISLIGVSDERGSVGGDIKFRFEFK